MTLFGNGRLVRGIEDWNLDSGCSHGLGEIAGPLQRRGHGVSGDVDRVVVELVEGEEEEQLLARPVEAGFRNDQRSADREAGILVAVPGPCHVGLVVEELVGVQHLVAHVIVARSVEPRCAVLGGERQLSGGAAAVFGRVIRNQQFDFADGIYARRDIAGIQIARVLAAGAVHVEDDLALLAAVDTRNTAARPTAIIARRRCLHARHAHDQANWVAAACRHFLDHLGAQRNRTIGTVSGYVD